MWKGLKLGVSHKEVEKVTMQNKIAMYWSVLLKAIQECEGGGKSTPKTILDIGRST